MVGAYTCFANLGTYSRPYFLTRIEDKDGNVLATFGGSHKEAIPESVAYQTTEMLKGVINKGTATKLRSRFGLQLCRWRAKPAPLKAMPMLGLWATTPTLVVGAWVGFEQPSVHFASNSTGAGGTGALPIVGGFLRSVFNDRVLKVSCRRFLLAFGHHLLCSILIARNLSCPKKQLPIAVEPALPH
jgi:penicillin-binding protein 1A